VIWRRLGYCLYLQLRIVSRLFAFDVVSRALCRFKGIVSNLGLVRVFLILLSHRLSIGIQAIVQHRAGLFDHWITLVRADEGGILVRVINVYYSPAFFFNLDRSRGLIKSDISLQSQFFLVPNVVTLYTSNNYYKIEILNRNCCYRFRHLSV
jgi:hypothetical protein